MSRMTGISLFLFFLLLLGCDPTRKEYEKFNENLKVEFNLAAKRLDGEEASIVSGEFRKRMGVKMMEMKNPSGVWKQYRQALIVLRFYETVERICGKDSEERNTNLGDISLAAVSHGFSALNGCRRLYLFSALYRAVAIERVNALTGQYDMDEKIQDRIKGASTDPDCLVRAGYLFLMGDEKETLRLARKLLGSPASFHCGLYFLDFIEPGDIDIALSGVETIVDVRVENNEKRKLLSELVEHLQLLIREEGEAVLRNLKNSYKSTAEKGKLALFLLSAIDEPWEGAFWEDVALHSAIPKERSLALKVLGRKKDEGLVHIKRILEYEEQPGAEEVLTESFVKEIANVFIVSWRNFSNGAVEKENILELLKDAAGKYPALEGKVLHVERLYSWEGEELSEQERADVFANGVNAIELELKSCWHKAKMKGMDIPGGVVNVSARMGEDGNVLDVSTQDTEIPSEALKDCVRGAFMMLSFNEDIFEEDEIVNVRLNFPFVGEAHPGEEKTGEGAGQEAQEGEESSPEEEAKEIKRVIPKKPAVGKVVVGGGKGVGIADIRKGLEPHLGYMAICAGAAMEKSAEFKPGEFTLKFDVVSDGRMKNIKISGDCAAAYFSKCVIRGLKKVKMKAPSTPKVWARVRLSFP